MPVLPAALIVMNQQIAFMNEATEYLPDRIGELLESVPFEKVFFTQFINPPHVGGLSQTLGWDGLALDDPETGIVPQFIHQAKDHTITTSGFGLPLNVLPHLYGTSVNTVYLTGVETDCNIFKAAFDLFETNYRPVVLADYCASCGGAERHNSALALLRRHIGNAQVHAGQFGRPEFALDI